MFCLRLMLFCRTITDFYVNNSLGEVIHLRPFVSMPFQLTVIYFKQFGPDLICDFIKLTGVFLRPDF